MKVIVTTSFTRAVVHVFQLTYDLDLTGRCLYSIRWGCFVLLRKNILRNVGCVSSGVMRALVISAECDRTRFEVDIF